MIINQQAFHFGTLKQITFTSVNITFIRESFNAIHNLNCITINSKYIQFNENTFNVLSSLEKIFINSIDSNALVTFESNTFYKCDKFETIEIINPNTNLVINENAFANTKIKTWKIDQTYEKFDILSIIKHCPNLESIIVISSRSDIKYISNTEDLQDIGNAKHIKFVSKSIGQSEINSLNIDFSQNEIDEISFFMLKKEKISKLPNFNVNKITFYANISNFESSPFKNITNLKSIHFEGSNQLNFVANTFDGLHSLDSITIKDNTDIDFGNSVFEGLTLKSFILPKNSRSTINQNSFFRTHIDNLIVGENAIINRESVLRNYRAISQSLSKLTIKNVIFNEKISNFQHNAFNNIYSDYAIIFNDDSENSIINNGVFQLSSFNTIIFKSPNIIFGTHLFNETSFSKIVIDSNIDNPVVKFSSEAFRNCGQSITIEIINHRRWRIFKSGESKI
ncbi:hypothetical protein TVAG_382260 [Trichomonas vaginalis G3]|uniref:Surface antigen BspA-like n=1 Tax=Trichomonas vaginalis (strain ATCC PRA-98 / G3) TaxID=412133 RepID=A2FNE5_TRIV3|nr:BspA type Leucine rich repeat region (6 copies) family [Trichomonas vaginalis G3]EAX93581.1 hypothetical protein TVAG_382260 [Trichomonas vaginalis G3]KAI5540347.1 BspA type Leucine rich repeat region (6 copies) family [Trichomonas vaginalis G3]|eukprot:XP_001306511.1 hypothetical protein [Trichomonas vaginalis G3]